MKGTLFPEEIAGGKGSILGQVATVPGLEQKSHPTISCIRELPMSSTEENELFQPVQLPQDQVYAHDGEDSISSSEELSDIANAEEITVSEPIPPNAQDKLSQRGDEASNSPIDSEDVGASDEDSPQVATPPSRPNEYRGPPSTWRNWTAPERELATSLDQLGAKDLAVHLFNAVRLKQRGGNRYRRRQVQKSGDENEGSVGKTWVPPQVWTAWPLAPAEVPREGDERRWEDHDALSKPYPGKTSRPSEVLGELLVAQVLRKARGRFREREWGHSEPETPRSRRKSSSKAQPHRSGESNHDEKPMELRPVIMADDERASQILQPTIRHVMAKLDDLLMGLHHARSSYVSFDDSEDKSQSQTKERMSSRSRARKRNRSISATLPEMIASSGLSEDSAAENELASKAMSGPRSQTKRPRPSSRKSENCNTRSRKRIMGVRDWSDVLGIASMTGWEPSVVERSAARCASLFGENITFRTLEEGEGGFVENIYQPNANGPIVVSQTEKPEAKKEVAGIWKSEEEMFGGVHVDGFLKPIEGKKSWKYQNKGSKQRSTSRRSKG